MDSKDKDDGPKTKAAEVKKAAEDKVQMKKPSEKGGSFEIPSLPPAADTYKQSELLMVKPSRKLLAEMESRGYAVVRSNGGGLAHVILPPDAGNAWDVQRELERSFPGQRVGLNYIYKPYHPQQGAPSGLTPRSLAPIGPEGCSRSDVTGPASSSGRRSSPGAPRP